MQGVISTDEQVSVEYEGHNSGEGADHHECESERHISENVCEGQ